MTITLKNDIFIVKSIVFKKINNQSFFFNYLLLNYRNFFIKILHLKSQVFYSRVRVQVFRVFRPPLVQLLNEMPTSELGYVYKLRIFISPLSHIRQKFSKIIWISSYQWTPPEIANSITHKLCRYTIPRQRRQHEILSLPSTVRL